MTAPRVVEIPLPLFGGRPPLTSNQRLHWAEKSRRTAQIRSEAAWLARAAGIPAQDYVVVQLHYRPKDHRRRDASNLVPTQKPAVDGLVDAKVVPDDTARWVGELMPVIHEPSGSVPALWLAVSVGVSRSDAAAIAADVRFERTEDAATREEADA